MKLAIAAAATVTVGVSTLALPSCDPDVSYLRRAGGVSGHGGETPPSAGAGSSADSGGRGGAGDQGGSSEGGSDAAMGGSGSVTPENGGSENGGSGGDGAGPRTEILSDNGVVLPSSNDYGINGQWRKFGADPDLIVTDFSGGSVCIKGIVKGAANGDFSRYWGGGLQLVLRSGGAAYDATANGLAGISVALTGAQIPAALRLKFKRINSNENYCKNVTPVAKSPLSLLVSEAAHNCWLAGGPAIPPSELENLELHMVPSDDKDIHFDFCVARPTVIPAAG